MATGAQNASNLTSTSLETTTVLAGLAGAGWVAVLGAEVKTSASSIGSQA